MNNLNIHKNYLFQQKIQKALWEYCMCTLIKGLETNIQIEYTNVELVE